MRKLYFLALSSLHFPQKEIKKTSGRFSFSFENRFRAERLHPQAPPGLHQRPAGHLPVDGDVLAGNYKISQKMFEK